jgi:hypothetical protein
LIEDVAPMQNIFEISAKKVFSLTQAQELLPVIYHITETAQSRVKNLINQLESVRASNSVTASALEQTINSEVDRWQLKMEKLGVCPKGLWLADFDNGTGYYCWKFPETQISFWHGYKEGYTGRKPVRESETESETESQSLKNLESDTTEKTSYENRGRSNQHYSRKLSEEFNKDH